MVERLDFSWLSKLPERIRERQAERYFTETLADLDPDDPAGLRSKAMQLFQNPRTFQQGIALEQAAANRETAERQRRLLELQERESEFKREPVSIPLQEGEPGYVPSTQAPAAPTQDRAQRLFSRITERSRAAGVDLPPHVTQGIVAGLAGETAGFDPTAQERQPVVPGSRGGFGLAQWTGDRRVGLENFARARQVDPGNEDTQIDYGLWEMTRGPERAAGQALLRARNAQEATQIFRDRYLRPGIPHREAPAQQALAQLAPTPLPPERPPVRPAPPPPTEPVTRVAEVPVAQAPTAQAPVPAQAPPRLGEYQPPEPPPPLAEPTDAELAALKPPPAPQERALHGSIVNLSRYMRELERRGQPTRDVEVRIKQLEEQRKSMSERRDKVAEFRLDAMKEQRKALVAGESKEQEHVLKKLEDIHKEGASQAAMLAAGQQAASLLDVIERSGGTGPFNSVLGPLASQVDQMAGWLKNMGVSDSALKKFTELRATSDFAAANEQLRAIMVDRVFTSNRDLRGLTDEERREMYRTWINPASNIRTNRGLIAYFNKRAEVFARKEAALHNLEDSLDPRRGGPGLRMRDIRHLERHYERVLAQELRDATLSDPVTLGTAPLPPPTQSIVGNVGSAVGSTGRAFEGAVDAAGTPFRATPQEPSPGPLGGVRDFLIGTAAPWAAPPPQGGVDLSGLVDLVRPWLPNFGATADQGVDPITGRPLF